MKVLSGLAVVGATFLLAACSRQSPQANVSGSSTNLSLKSLVIALKPDKNPDAMLEEKKTLEAFLSGQIGIPVEVKIPLASAVILEGFQNGTVDLGYLSATEMIAARDKGSASLLLAGEIEGNPWYKSYWVALKEKPYTRVEDLRGKPVAFSSKTSTSGYLIPHWSLIRKGLVSPKGDPEEFFGKGNVWYGSGYVSAIEQVLNGSAEAAAVSYYVLDKDKHLTVEQRAKLKRIDEQGPVPTHVIAIRSSIPETDRAVIRAALETLNDPPNHALRDKVFTSKLVPANEQEHIAPLHEALVLTGKLEK